MNIFQNKKFAQLLSIFSIFLIFLAMILATLFSKNRKQTVSHAQETVDCAQLDPGNENYCGDAAPFRGCVGGVGGNEWLCMCRLKSGKWWSECSTIEAQSQKQPYIDKCGGDKEKAFMQWKYDMPILEAGGECSCGGQNVCGSLVPTKPAGVFTGGGGSGVAPTDVVYPTSAPRALPTQSELPPVQTNQSNQNNFPQQVFPTIASPLNMTLPQLSFPTFHFPSIEFHPDLSGLNRLASTPLDFLESIFHTVTTYDAQLESTINNVFHR